MVPLGQLAFLYGFAKPWLVKNWPWFARRVVNRQSRRAARHSQAQSRWPQLAPLSASGFLLALLLTATWVFHDMRVAKDNEIKKQEAIVSTRDATIKTKTDENARLQRLLDTRMAREQRATILGNLMGEANLIQNRQVSTDAEFAQWKADLNTWYIRCKKEFSREFPLYDWQAFETKPGNTFSFDAMGNFNGEHNNYLNWLDWRIANLRTLLAGYTQ